LLFMSSKASAMPFGIDIMASALPNSEFSFSFFYLFEIKFSFQVWQGLQ
jgi:hypothetical protein